MSSHKKYTFHVRGMHCSSCVVLTEDKLKGHPNISHAVSSLQNSMVEIHGNFGDRSHHDIVKELSDLLSSHGYSLSVEKPPRKIVWREFGFAAIFALLFITAFLFLQKLGIVNLVNTGEVGLGTAFLIGVIASLSTCMAVVGGLVLSMSSVFAKEGDSVRPQVLFHAGRLISFFVGGGIIGALGAFVSLGPVSTFVLGLLIGIIMLLLGLNLLDLFHLTKRFQPTLPKFFSRHIVGIAKLNHTLTPFLVGIATFFLPCGFTQSMQIYSLSTGSFGAGAMTMSVFALGTLPALLLLSFGSVGIKNEAKKGIFFKTAGLIVVFFAVLNITSSLVTMGIIPPVFNF